MNNTLTVRQLIEQLERFDDNLPVRLEDLSEIDHAYISEIRDEKENLKDTLVILGKIPF